METHANTRKADHSAEREFGKFLDECFYPRIAGNGISFVRETGADNQLAGIDVICRLSDGREFYFDEKCKVNNLSSPKKVDVIPAIGFELGSLQRQQDGERVVRTGWFVADGLYTSSYFIFQAFSDNPDKATVKSTDFRSAICLRIGRRALQNYVCEKLGTTVDGIAQMDWTMRNTQELTDAGKGRLFISSSVYCHYVATNPVEEGDEEVKGLTVTLSKAIDEQPVNLVIPWNSLIGIKGAKQYYITRDVVETLEDGANALDYAKERWGGWLVKEEVPAVEKPVERQLFGDAPKAEPPAVVKDNTEREAVKERSQAQTRYEKTGITRIEKGIYDDIVMDSGYFIRDSTMNIINGWLDKYAKALENKWVKEGSQGDEKQQKHYKVRKFISLTGGVNEKGEEK